MVWLLGNVLSRMAVDVSLAFVAFFVGFFTAHTYARYRQQRRRSAAPGTALAVEPAKPLPAESSANDIARTNMAALQLRDLAQNVASDVGAHNTLVEGIADQLLTLETAESGNGAVVKQAIAQILDANRKLAARLEDAEQKIQSQAEEIRIQQSEARTDALTKLANRRAFDLALAASLEAFLAHGKPFSLVMLDVDHFKRVNDNFGHPAGDEVLRTVGKTLPKHVASSDLACRYGGEEFAVILHSAVAADAQAAAERLRRAVEAMAVRFSGEVLRVTASVGMADFSERDDGASIVRRADEAVYAAKRHGRNCTYWHDGDHCLPITPPPAEQAASDDRSRPLPSAGSSAPLEQTLRLADRAAFADELNRRIAESHRFGYTLSLLCLRVRDFERLQVTFGDAIGEMLIDSLAAFVQSTLRDMDLIGRLDDSRLIVLLPGCTASAARIVGQRVRTSISLCPIPLGPQQIRLDLETGVATVQPQDDAASAMAHAQAALEAAAVDVGEPQPAGEPTAV